MRAVLDKRFATVTSLCAAICLSLSFHNLVSAQATSWVRTGGPLGGVGYDIKARPDNPDVMYATDMFAGVHKSVDGGLTWSSINEGIVARSGQSGDHIPAFSVTIDPNNPDVVWVGMQNSTDVYRSADGGARWERRRDGIVEKNNLTVRGITVQPGNSNVVYIAGEIPVQDSTGAFQQGKSFGLTRGVVYKSNDGGQTWAAVWRGDNLARYIIIDPKNVNTVYVSTGIFDREAANSRPEFNEPGGVGILKSTNGGATWTTINNGLDSLIIGSLVMHPTDPMRLLAATGDHLYSRQGGIFLTTDAGASWKYVGGVGKAMMASVEFSTNNPSIAYASSPSSFFRSDDGGQNWSSYLNRNGRSWGPDGISPGFPIDMLVDLRDSRRLFVNSYGGGNFLTLDGGASWTSASIGYTGADVKDVAVSRQNPAVVYANGQSGPFKSIDGGQTWVGINPIDVREFNEGARVVVDPEDDNHVLMSSANGAGTYESLDGARTWRLVTDYSTELAKLPPDRAFQGMQALAFAPSRRLKVYGGFGHARCITQVQAVCDAPTIAGVLTSEDGGHTWTRRTGTGFDTSTVPAIVVHPLDHNTAWAATMSQGIFKTTDGGARWTVASTGLTDLRVESLAMDPTRPEVLYAGTSSKGILKSRDGGGTWAASGTGMRADEPIKAIVVNPAQPDVVYAGSRVSGVYASTNGGTSWTLINNGLRNRGIRALTISADGRVLYAGTWGEGVFRLGAVPALFAAIASASGSSSSLTLDVSLTVAAADVGQNGEVYIAANLDSQWYFFTGSGWVPWTSGNYPAYLSGVLPSSETVRVLAATNVNPYRGTSIYVAYGRSSADMLARGLYRLVYTL